MKASPILWAWILALGLGAGCASSPPSRFYTLTPLPSVAREPAPSDSGPAIGLGPVGFPAFLDRPQIVSRDSANRLDLNEYRRWAGTIQDDFMRVWSENLAYLIGTSRIVVFPTEIRYPLDFRIAADVLAFEGDAQGEAVLRVRWSILEPDLTRVLASDERVYRQPWRTGPGQPGDESALVAAMSDTLGAFSRDVAESVKRLPKPVQEPGPPPLY